MTDAASMTHIIAEILGKLTGQAVGGADVGGVIRVRGACECGGKYQFRRRKVRAGYVCQKCGNEARRYFLDMRYDDQRVRIYCDRTGQPLDTYERAIIAHEVVSHEILSDSFDPSNYSRAEKGRYWCSRLLDHDSDDKKDDLGYLQHKLPVMAPSYRKDHRRMVGIAKDYFGTKDVRKLRRKELEDYKAYLEHRGYAGKTLKNILDHFKAFLNWCRIMGVLQAVPEFPAVEYAESLPRWISQDEQIGLYELVPDADKPFVAFLMLHGCRPGEARALKCKDVNLRTTTVTIFATFSGETYREKQRKGKKRKQQPLVLPIHPELEEYITARVRGSHPEAWLFVDRRGMRYTQDKLFRLWDKVRRDAGISKALRLYDCTRHSFASQLVHSGVPLFRVSKMLGHSSIAMTEKYSHENITGARADLSKLSLKSVPVVSLDEKRQEKR